MELCCYGCGQEGKYQVININSENHGKKRCCKSHRSCPIKRKESAEKISISKKGSIPWNKGKTSKDDNRILIGNKNGMFGKNHSKETKLKISRNVSLSIAGENNPNWNPTLDRSGISIYRSKVMRLSKKTYNENIKIINPNDLILGTHDKNCYQLDHIIPISKGYQLKIKPEIMASLDNLQILFWRENMKKGNKILNNDVLTILLTKNKQILIREAEIVKKENNFLRLMRL